MSLKVKGNNGKIELLFDEDISIEKALCEIDALKNNSFFAISEGEIAYNGLNLTYDEEMALFRRVKKIFGKNIKFNKRHTLSNEEILYSLSENEAILKVINKSLRSGESVVSRGDVIVYGDVNAGARVEADGNVTVVGALRGSIYIKNKGCVYATYMEPSQIRIGNVISYKKRAKKVGAALCRAENGEIILECL
ncbi:MAG: septum site-determining protein MinC [Clostridia bacterium]|nr:septum site-determining protein MinC [Clostridia bacterium]